MKTTIDVARDIRGIPTVATINRAGRILTVKFDGDKGFELEGQRGIMPSFADLVKIVYPVTSVLSVRGLNWYDRNPISRVSVYEAYGVGPHAVTTRATYTVPQDRILIVDHIFTSVIRVTAADPVGYVHASFRISQAANNYTIQRGHILTNTVGDKDTAVSAPNLALLAGQGWNLRTYDGSTGGTIGYCLAAKGVEFDA